MPLEGDAPDFRKRSTGRTVGTNEVRPRDTMQLTLSGMTFAQLDLTGQKFFCLSDIKGPALPMNPVSLRKSQPMLWRRQTSSAVLPSAQPIFCSGNSPLKPSVPRNERRSRRHQRQTQHDPGSKTACFRHLFTGAADPTKKAAHCVADRKPASPIILHNRAQHLEIVICTDAISENYINISLIYRFVYRQTVFFVHHCLTG